MSHYTHLSIKEREKIYLMRGMGASIREIARELQRSPATVSRALRRGSDSRHCYTPSGAQARYQMRRKNCGRRRILANAKIKELFSRIPAAAIKTLTPDRGSEFARYAELELSMSNLTVYFPAPHAPWERGTNENSNGLIREHLPKYQDMSDVSEK